MSFFTTLGRLPHTWLNLLLTLVAGVTQGVGIALFIPVLKLMEGSAGDLPKPFLVVRDAMATVGLPFNLPVLLVVIVLFIVAGLGLNFTQRCLLQGYSWMHYVRRIRSIVIESLLDAQWPHSAKQATDTALFGRLFPAKSIIDQNTRVFLEDYYRSGNRALAKGLGLPLAQYGYPV